MKPMLEEGGSEHALRLLRAGREDAPSTPEERQAKVLAALLAVRATAPLPKPTHHGLWFAGGIVASVGAVLLWSATQSPVRIAQPTPVRHAAAAKAVASDDGAWAPLPSAPPVESLPGTTAVTKTARSEGDALALIDQARQHLRSGDAPGTLADVRRYRQEFPNAAYRDEADALEIQALLQSGDTARAHALGRAFLQRRAGSPQAARIARLLGDAP